MDKIAELKRNARSLGVGGILGAGAGIAAADQIRKNKNNARARKGWDTRRRNGMQKKASDNKDTLPEVKSAVRTLGVSLDNPTKAAKIYAVKSLITKVRNLFNSHKANRYAA